jgi:dihydropteroate synthase-like protein
MTKAGFVTGKLAAKALADILTRIQPDFDYEILVPNITVASLMSCRHLIRTLIDHQGVQDFKRLIISGMCAGNFKEVENRFDLKIEKGPKDLLDLPSYLGHRDLKSREGYGGSKIKIMAEIVDAHLLSLNEILSRAQYYQSCGADIIDLGCSPESFFRTVDVAVRYLKDEGFVVSIDTFDPKTIEMANQAGVDFVLSINSSNVALAKDLSCRVVVVPDFGEGLDSLEKNIERLEKAGVKDYIIDPIIEPINFGFSRSLYHFYVIREKFPEKEMFMGIGNITELTDADSTGINALLVGIATELNVQYLLTTEADHRAIGSVREVDIARKLMFFSNQRSILPKHLDYRLFISKDPQVSHHSQRTLRDMQQTIKDRNFRIFVDESKIIVFNSKIFVQGTDPQEIFPQLGIKDVGQVFYLGKELMKAKIALDLKKKYIQEHDLNWGYLSNPEEPQAGQV